MICFPPKIEYDRDNDVLIARLTGTQSMESVIAAYDEARKHSDYRPGMNRIWDMRNAKFADALESPDATAMTKLSNLFERAPSSGQIAVVVPNTTIYGMARQFQLASETELSIRMHVCRSLDEAYEMLATEE